MSALDKKRNHEGYITKLGIEGSNQRAITTWLKDTLKKFTTSYH